MRIESGGRNPWQLCGAQVPCDAATRLRLGWQAQRQAATPTQVANMDWRAQTVYRLLAQPERWGAVGAVLAPRLIAQCGRLGAGGVLDIVDACGAPIERLDVSVPRGRETTGADRHWQICRDGARFGLWRAGDVEWSDERQPYGGLCHVLIASASRRTLAEIADVVDDDVEAMVASLPDIVCEAPDVAQALWQDLMGGPADGGHVSEPAAAGALFARGTLWAVAGTAAYALGTSLPLAGAITAGALQIGVLGGALRRAVSTLSSHADPAERAKYEAALALSLPELGCADLKALMARLEGADARLDFFHLTSAIRRRLATRTAGQTPGDVVRRLPVRDFERAERENTRRTPNLTCGKQALETLLDLASQHGLLSPWGDEVASARQSWRAEAWQDELYAWDRAAWQRAAAIRYLPGPDSRTSQSGQSAQAGRAESAGPSARVELAGPLGPVERVEPLPLANDTLRPRHAAVSWPSIRIAPPARVTPESLSPAIAGGVYAAPPFEPDDARAASHAADPTDPTDPTDPLLNTGSAIATWTMTRALRVGLKSRTVQVGGLALGAVSVAAAARYAYHWAASWLSDDPQRVDSSADSPADSPAESPSGSPISDARRAEAPLPPPAVRDLRDGLSLSKLLTLGDWMAWDDAAHTYRDAADSHTAWLIKDVLTQRSAGLVPSNVSAMLDEWVNVTYRSIPFLVMGNAHGVPSMTLTTVEKYRLRDVALGHHYQKELLKLGATKEVRSVAVSDGNPEVTRLLNAVNNDDFRQALYDADIAHLAQLERAPEAVAAFGHYVNARTFAMILQARLSEGSPAWAADIVKQAAAESERGNTLRLLTFHKRVMPGLLAARHTNGENALLVSLKSGTWLWWDRTVERSALFREFMTGHLSARDLVKLDNPVHISDLQFRIGRKTGPGSGIGWGPGDGGPVGLWFANTETRREMYQPDFEFQSSNAIRDELWKAEVRTVRENMDVRIATKSWRDRRDRLAIQHAMLQGSGVFFPLLFGAFPLSVWVSPAAFGAGVATSFANLMLVSAEAKDTDLAGLRKAQHDMKLGTLMMFVHLLPIGAAEWRIFRAAFGYTLAASGHLLRSSHAAMDAMPSPNHDERRAMVQSLVGLADLRLPDNASPMETPQRPWDVIDHVRAAYGGTSDSNIRRTVAIRNRNVNGFLGLRRAPVTTRDELLRLPPGYAIALADEFGTMFFAGMTCGDGEVVGSGTDPAIVTLPTDFAVIDFAGKHADILTFHGNGSVEVSGAMFSMFIDETIRQRVPAIPIFDPDAGRVAVRPAPSEAPETILPNPPLNPLPGSPLSPLARLLPASQTLEEKVSWSDIVALWRANRLGMRLRTIDQIAAYQVSGFRSQIFQRWNVSEFKAALSDVLARVETGLLLWHLPFLDAANQGLALRRLQGVEPLRTARLYDATLYGVVALSGVDRLDEARVSDGVRNYLLLSLITGDALGWTGNLTIKGRQALQAFVRPHLSEHRLWVYRGLLNEDRALPGVPSDASPDPLAAVTFVTRRGGHGDMVNDLHSRIFWDLHCRASAIDICMQDDRSHDLLFLVAYAASVLPPDDAKKLTRAVRALLRPRTSDTPFAPPREITDAALIHTRWTGPDLSLAHSIGLMAREAAAANGTYPLAGKAPEEAVMQAINFVDAHLTPYTKGVARGEMAGLVEWGVGSSTFGRSLLNASFHMQATDRFAAVIDTIWDSMPISADGYTSGTSGRGLIRINDAPSFAAVPPGYRLFLTSPLGNDYDVQVWYEMFSLGQGVVAGWTRRFEDGRLPPRLERIDLLANNTLLAFTGDGVVLKDGTPVSMCAEGLTPGIHVEPRCPPASNGTVDGTLLEQEIVAVPLVLTAIERRSDGADANLLAAIHAAMQRFNVTNIRCRVVLTWSHANQFKPDWSYALVGDAEKPFRRSETPCRVVVDIFASHALPDTLHPPYFGYIASEAQWQAAYVARAGNRHVKYVDFHTIEDALNAAPTFADAQGVLPFDYQENALLLHAPAWPNFPQPGWHPRQNFR
ncbi:hypothetical protein PIN31009_03032 [Pandoraea iniqua]|uniref:hypothetical protein n=1 Tax=Pandoraea iniqua TaxID=2508288 RepID=UPI00123F28AC|nr:hypothetical protein [Pandoraea iniqua]VVE19017.1 hypothetical protein PIN31009_03032 [Pandoraea iniqua]